ncbi:MAG: hypothetical protein ACI9NQ_001488 [Paracoccaceae bacterium]|jgi:hypothetical protein
MRILLLSLFSLATSLVYAAPELRVSDLGKAMGGWKDKSGKAARFEVSGSTYRCWKPEVSPTPLGGIFISLRIDHLRGIFASDDHASLELTFDKDGNVVSARSSIALQGKKVTSDLIEGTGKLGASLVGMALAAKVGTEMISNLSAKILRENIKEPGRVSFPAVMQHQYNLLCLAVTMPVDGDPEKTDDAPSENEERKIVPLKVDPPGK